VRVIIIKLLIASSILAFLAVLLYLKKGSKGKWQQTLGVVTSNSIHEFKTDMVTRKESSRAVGYLSYKIDFEYEYSVNGQKYSSNRILWLGSTDTFDTEEEAVEFTKPYPVGKEVLVYYKPDKPSNSCLYSPKALLQPPILIILWITLTFVFIAFGFVAMMFAGKIKI
jgi:hypothetical protein